MKTDKISFTGVQLFKQKPKTLRDTFPKEAVQEIDIFAKHKNKFSGLIDFLVFTGDDLAQWKILSAKLSSKERKQDAAKKLWKEYEQKTKTHPHS